MESTQQGSGGAARHKRRRSESGRRKGSGKDHAKIGGDKNNESMVRRPRLCFFGSCSSSLVPNTHEAVSASSSVALEVDKAISEECWTALAKEKERDWWSIDLEGEVEELEVGARTVNLCQQCYNERQVQQCESRLNSWQWRAVVEKKAHRGRIWRITGNEQFTRGMWECFTLKRAEAKKIRMMMLRERSKKEYKVSGSRSLHSGHQSGPWEQYVKLSRRW